MWGEAEESEGQHRQARSHQCRERRAGSWNGVYQNATLDAGLNQLQTRVADARRAGIGHEGEALGTGQAPEQLWQPSPGVVFVKTDGPSRDTVRGEQSRRAARIFSGDQGHLTKDAQRPKRDVLEVADRGRDHVQRAGHRVRSVGYCTIARCALPARERHT